MPPIGDCQYCRGHGHYDGCPYCGETPENRRIRHATRRDKARARARLNRRARRQRAATAAAFLAAAAVYVGATVQAATAAELAVGRDQLTATQVREWLVRQGFPVYDRPMWVADTIISPYATTSEIAAVASPAGPVLVRGVTTGPDSRLTVANTLIHEYLHSMRDTREYASLTPAERRVEEGAVTAVTEDLSPRFECAVWRGCGPTGWLVFDASGDRYSRWAAMVRGVSRRATGRPVTSPQARAWRYQLVRADRAARAVMWARATGVMR